MEVGDIVETTQGVWEILRSEAGFYLLSAPTGSPAGDATRKWMAKECVEAIRLKYVLSYTHRHGTDVCVLEDEDAAYRAACNIIITWWDELSEAAQDAIRPLVEQEKYREAVDKWDEWSSESLTIERLRPGDDSVPQVPPREE